MGTNEAVNMERENCQMETLKEANKRLRSCSFKSLNHYFAKLTQKLILSGFDNFECTKIQYTNSSANKEVDKILIKRVKTGKEAIRIEY